MASGLRFGGHDAHLAAHQRIHQRRLADVGTADDGDMTGTKCRFAHDVFRTTGCGPSGGRISDGRSANSFVAANCSARRRLPPSPTAASSKTGTSHITVNDCACASPATAVNV